MELNETVHNITCNISMLKTFLFKNARNLSRRKIKRDRDEIRQIV